MFSQEKLLFVFVFLVLDLSSWIVISTASILVFIKIIVNIVDVDVLLVGQSAALSWGDMNGWATSGNSESGTTERHAINDMFSAN